MDSISSIFRNSIQEKPWTLNCELANLKFEFYPSLFVNTLDQFSNSGAFYTKKKKKITFFCVSALEQIKLSQIF